MSKAFYLFLVYLLPIVTAFLPFEHFQAIWVWFYLPFGLVYGVAMWFNPVQKMMKWVTLTPLLFLLYILLAVPALVAYEAGISAALELVPVIALFAIPAAIPIGAVYVAAAYLLFYGFVKYGYIGENS